MRDEQEHLVLHPKRELFGVYEEPNSGFVVVLPGLRDSEERIVGTTLKRFDTREAAEEAVLQSREGIRREREEAVLREYYSHFYRIEKQADGTFLVISPGLLHEDGYYVGTTHKKCVTWDEAKQFFLEKIASHEELAKTPLLDIQLVSGERVTFSDFEAFDPQVIPSESPLSLPPAIETYVLRKEQLLATDESASTYQETIQEIDWEKKLFAFVVRYLQKEGTGILQELEIQRLDQLTPRQAIELSLRVVLELTKYNKDDLDLHTSDVKKSNADTRTVRELLEEARDQKRNPDWKGNGVCRNFSSMLKAVFESIKVHQNPLSRLHNTYALYEAGTDVYNPGKEDAGGYLTVGGASSPKIGHAWNTFVTLTKEGVNAVVLDPTWGRVNRETGQMEDVDYTLTRMEPLVFALAQELRGESTESFSQFDRILQYYAFKADRPGGVEAVFQQKTKNERQKLREQREKRFFVQRAWLLIKRGSCTKIPDALVPLLNEEFLLHIEDYEAEDLIHLEKIKKETFGLRMMDIRKQYFQMKPMDNRHTRFFLFPDDALQRIAFEYMKERSEFEDFLKTAPSVRMRIREVRPEYFVDFDPTRNEADYRELQYLIERDQSLAFLSHFVRLKGLPSPEKLEKIFSLAHERLRSINPEKYEREKYIHFDGYEVLKNFTSLQKTLQLAL